MACLPLFLRFPPWHAGHVKILPHVKPFGHLCKLHTDMGLVFLFFSGYPSNLGNPSWPLAPKFFCHLSFSLAGAARVIPPHAFLGSWPAIPWACSSRQPLAQGARPRCLGPLREFVGLKLTSVVRQGLVMFEEEESCEREAFF